ncbi:hypothetical protein CWB71_20685, partial [Pseudoalteromonas sp. S983]
YSIFLGMYKKGHYLNDLFSSNNLIMKSSLQLRLYGGLAISVLLVLLVGFFSINALEKQVAQNNQLVHTKQTIDVVRDLR